MMGFNVWKSCSYDSVPITANECPVLLINGLAQVGLPPLINRRTMYTVSAKVGGNLYEIF